VTERSLEEVYTALLKSRIEGIVDRLRNIADQVECEQNPIVGMPGTRSYAGIAARIQHAVLWGIANLDLSELTYTAFEADSARLKPEEQ
jgi:hypothetical protein